MNNTYIGEIVEVLDNGDAILQFPDELIKELGWKEGDVLNLELHDNGSIIIRNITKEHNEQRDDYQIGNG